MVNWAVPYEHTVPFGHFFGVREVALWLTGQFHTDTQFHTNTQFYTDTHWCERGGFVVNWAVPYCIANLNMLFFFKCFVWEKAGAMSGSCQLWRFIQRDVRFD